MELHEAELSFETPSALTSAPWGLQGASIQLKSIEPHGSGYKNTLFFSAYNGVSLPLKPDEIVSITFGFGGALDHYSVEASFVLHVPGSEETYPDEETEGNEPEIDWVFPATDSRTLTGETLVLTVTASDEDDDLLSVDFYSNNTLVASKTAAPFEASLTVSPGTNTVYAEAKDAQGHSAMTSPITLTADILLSTDEGGSCDALNYAHHGDYLTGDSVQNNGQIYTCKQFGWCGQPAYEPGVAWYGNDYWKDAWTLVGPCNVNTNFPPFVDVILPSVGANAPFQLQVSAYDEDGEVTRVEYYLDGLWIGGAAHLPFAVSHPGLKQGNHSIFAVATDDQGVQSRSSTQTLEINTAFEGNIAATLQLGT